MFDVREPDEYEAGHIPGAVHVPLATVPDQVAVFPTDGPVYVVCAAGGRSMRACEFLRAQGVDAVNIAGGTRAWIQAGHAVASGAELG